jgi:hypothetical protein
MICSALIEKKQVRGVWGKIYRHAYPETPTK